MSAKLFKHRAFLVGEIEEENVSTLVRELYDIDDRYPSADIELVINSQGGSMIEGISLFSTLTELSTRGNGNHYLTTKIRGLAGSMATVILQAGDWRVSGDYDVTVWHEGRTNHRSSRPMSMAQEELDDWIAMDKRLEKIIQDRSGCSDETLRYLHGHNDLTLTAEKGLALNMIDEIR